mmetsp:Transcript_52307/g.111378  ORF Transcript_52307/g.111378 Transcript_52307/m.111378 type:complete len:361 (-) Transcript_52307:245-1327(-)
MLLVVHDLQGHLLGFFPFPLDAHLLFGQDLSLLLLMLAVGPLHHHHLLQQVLGDALLVAGDHVQLVDALALTVSPGSLLDAPKGCGHQLGSAAPVDAADVEGVADLAIQGALHRGLETGQIAVGRAVHPGAAGAVEAGGNTSLLSQGAQGGHCGARTSSYGQSQSPVAHQGVARGASSTVDETHSPFGQACLFQGRSQGCRHDFASGSQRVAANSEDHSVAAPQHAGRVGQHVGPALEDEADCAQGSPDHVHGPALVLHGLDDGSSLAGGRDPASQARNHALPHLLVGHEASGGAALLLRDLHVLVVRGDDLVPDGIALQVRRELLEELRDLLVGDGVHLPEGRLGLTNSVGCDLPLLCR